MAVELVIPSSGESITEVQIGDWYKSEGDSVQQDEVVVEIETEKASMDLPAPATGRISKILKKKGDMAHPGDIIAYIEEGAAGKGPSVAEKAGAKSSPAQPEVKNPTAATSRGSAEPRVMPAARRELAQSNLTAEQVTGTGPGGRILKEDVRRQASPGPTAPSATSPRERKASPPAPPSTSAGDRVDEIVPMSLLRKRTAQKLVEAQQTAALLTTFNEVDMTAVMKMRQDYQKAFTEKHGIKLGFMSFFVKAAVSALQRIPAINAEIRETSIVFHKYYDIGVAVSTEKGLVVPVLRDVDKMSFADIERIIEDLARRARENQLKIEDLQGGTFSISNGGIFGSLLSTPIVNPPQSGILGLHAIQERPVVRDGQIVARSMMYVALTYDHRIVDGRGAVTFLRHIKEVIEDPARLLFEV